MATTPKKKTVKKKSAVKKTVKKKAAVKKKAVTKKAAIKKATRKTGAKTGKIKVTMEQRHKMICDAAYYISLEKNSETVNPTEDWLQAEAAIDQICSLHEN